MGLAASLETLWSKADTPLIGKRHKSISPIAFEMILFMRKNKDLWGMDEGAIQANKIRLKVDKESRAEKKMDKAEQTALLLSHMGLDTGGKVSISINYNYLTIICNCT
jgi:hypothetical protein